MPRRPLSDASSLLFTRRGLRLRDTQNTHHWSSRVNNNGQRGWALIRLVLCLSRAQSRAYDRYPNTQFVLAAVYTEDNVGRLRDTVIGSADCVCVLDTIPPSTWAAGTRTVHSFLPSPPPCLLGLLVYTSCRNCCNCALHYIHFTIFTSLSVPTFV